MFISVPMPPWTSGVETYAIHLNCNSVFCDYTHVVASLPCAHCAIFGPNQFSALPV
jgi:hypothetical protein